MESEVSKRSYKYWKNLFEKYERHISSVALLTGFVIDSLTLRRIDQLFENLVLLGYLFVAGTGIVLINLYEGGVIKNEKLKKAQPFLPVVVQFAFGALFSGFVVFYTRSSALITSWPFLLLLVSILIGNEILRKYYLHLAFHTSIFFIALFSFSIFYIPVAVKSMNEWTFLASGVLSIILITLFLYTLARFIPERIRANRNILVMSIGSIFIIINLFYFTNILPPIPLSLKEASAYHSLTRIGLDYVAEREPKAWYSSLWPRETLHIESGRPVYVYSAVFAPTELNINIVHHWQYYSYETGSWISSNRVTFPITGGRDGGYRGYSVKQNVFPGLWRVDVETPRGQIIGRVKFEIEHVTIPIPLIQEVF